MNAHCETVNLTAPPHGTALESSPLHAYAKGFEFSKEACLMSMWGVRGAPQARSSRLQDACAQGWMHCRLGELFEEQTHNW